MRRTKPVADGLKKALWMRTAHVRQSGGPWQEYENLAGTFKGTPYGMGADAGEHFSWPEFRFIRADIGPITRTRELFYKATETEWRVTYTLIIRTLPLPNGVLVPMGDIPVRVVRREEY